MALPVGIQLFGVRDSMEKDPVATLREVAKMGYSGVEMYSFAGLSPAEFRKVCDESGLSVMSAHGGYGFCVENIDETIRDLKAVGASYITQAYIGDNHCPGGEDFEIFVSTMKEAAKKARDAGMQMLHHNHEHEIGLVGDKFQIDMIVDAFDDGLLLPELDTCWIKVAGQDPVEFLKRYKNRCPIVHIKDFYCTEISCGEDGGRPEDFEIRPVGYGRQDMPGILHASEEIGAKWVVVEQDNPSLGLSELECAALSRDWLTKIGW